MKPKDSEFATPKSNLFKQPLEEQLNKKHPLFILTNKMDWQQINEHFGKLYSNNGRPGIPTRVLVGLTLLKHTFSLSDEEVVSRFVENPYYQYFCGFQFFEHDKPCDETSLVYWRKRVGVLNLEKLLSETLSTACKMKFLKPKEIQDVIVDTTVQEKNISFPHDAKLLNKARQNLVKESQKQGIKLRQTYTRIGKTSFVKTLRYGHAKQFKRARREIKKLKTILGRVLRDVQRKVENPDNKFKEAMEHAARVLLQKKNSRNKIYSLHEPHVECICKGKTHKRYEFGCKVSVVTTSVSNWVLGIKACHGNPYDGHTLPEVLNQVERIVGQLPKDIYADKGYRGGILPSAFMKLHISGTKRGKSRIQLKNLKRRSSIEPVIGHLKSKNRLERNYLKGINGDRINAILAGCGRNLRKILALILCFYFFRENIFFG